ncbi:MAG: hypothetical protein ACLFUY_08550 [Desulfobacterales bacterium]
MRDTMPSTMDDLKNRRRQSLENARKAIAARPGEYRELKRVLDRVVCHSVDISDYHRTARELVGLLEALNAACPGSVFDYYYTHMHPDKKGDARYFKVLCADLRQQIKSVDQYRRRSHNLRLVE